MDDTIQSPMPAPQRGGRSRAASPPPCRRRACCSRCSRRLTPASSRSRRRTARASLRPRRRAAPVPRRAAMLVLARLAASPARSSRAATSPSPRAYMDGRWDTPDLAALLTRARGQPTGAGARVLRRCVAARAVPREALAQRQHAGGRRSATSSPTTTSATISTRLWLDATMTYSSALFGGRSKRPLAAAQRAKYHRILDRARAAAGRAHSRDRLRLGRIRRNRGARRPPRDRPVAVRRADGVRARASRARRPRRPRRRSGCRIIATCAAPTTASRRSRCSRPSASATGPRTSAPSVTRSARAAAPASRPSPSPTRASSATGRNPTSSSSTSFPAACWPRRRDSPPSRGAAGPRARARAHLRPRLRGDAQRWLAAFDANAASDPCAGLRRALHPLLALLPRVLRRGLRDRDDRCRPVHVRRALTADVVRRVRGWRSRWR